MIRPALKADRWTHQQLVLQLIWSEALEFHLRVIGYCLAKILLGVLMGIEV